MAVILLALVVLAVFVERWSVENALKGVEFDYGPSLLLAAPDEKFTITANLANRSMRFIPFIKVEEYLPPDVKLYEHNAKVVSDFKGDFWYTFATFLMPRSGLRRDISASIPRRGRYIFRGAQLSGGDFLGLKEQEQRAEANREIVIYPRETAAEGVSEFMGGFLGDLSVRRFIIEDPVLTAGFREYTGREPMKAISWTQSARTGSIMVRNFDYTTEPSVTVLLNVECREEDREDLIESCYSITHTVCRILEERKVKYDFYTNATTSGAFADWSYIGEGLGAKHFLTILEGLGRASYMAREPFSACLKKVDQRSARSYVVITPTDNDQARSILNRENAGQTLVIPATTP